jgi:AraC family transcriptional regulator
MPKFKTGPGRVLRGGEFYSPVTASGAEENLLFSELRQPPAAKVPRHEHELAYLTLVLNGHYAETNCGGRAELHPFTAIFNPAGIAHSGEVGRNGARLFSIELRPECLQGLDVTLPDCPLHDGGAGTLLWPGLRIYSLFKAGIRDPLTMESRFLELQASLMPSSAGAKFAPPWFLRIRERLHEEFRSNLRLGDLAAEVGVHPVHLARVFRTHARKSAGDYLRDLRVRAACDLLRKPDFPLAAVAADCGFADQSHFTRVFKKKVNATPGEFRRMHSRS